MTPPTALSLALLAFTAGPAIAGIGRAANPVRLLLQENRLDEATTVCRQFEALSTPDLDNFVACAWVYARIGKVESAERILGRAKDRGGVEREILTAYLLVKRKKFGEAKQALDAVNAEARGTPSALTIQEVSAELYEEQGKPDTAAFVYKQIIGEDPKRARAQWGLGRYYLGKNEPGRAKQHLEEVTRLWPKHLGSRYNLAVLALSQDQYSDAAKWLAECYKLDRSDVGVLEQMGVLFEKKGMLDEAVKYWQRAISLNKDAPVAKEKLGTHVLKVIDSLIAQSEFTQALQKLQAMKSGMGKDPAWLLRRGVVYRNLGKFDKAAADLSSYLKANPDDALANREIGISYLNRTTVNPSIDKSSIPAATNAKWLNLAANHLARAAGAEPSNGMNYAWLAFVLEGKNLYPQARDAWKKATELLSDPKEVDKASRRLAAVEKRLKEKDGEAESERREKRKKDEDGDGDEDDGDMFQQLPVPGGK